MTRRHFTAWAFLVSAPLAAQDGRVVTLRGKLVQRQGQPSMLAVEGGKSATLSGDESTEGVLKDARLKDAEFEVTGNWGANETFVILPIHKRGMYVHRDGKRLFVTYWCDVCSIRTYTPGVCWCCQDETALDLREKLDN